MWIRSHFRSSAHHTVHLGCREMSRICTVRSADGISGHHHSNSRSYANYEKEHVIYLGDDEICIFSRLNVIQDFSQSIKSKMDPNKWIYIDKEIWLKWALLYYYRYYYFTLPFKTWKCDVGILWRFRYLNLTTYFYWYQWYSRRSFTYWYTHR